MSVRREIKSLFFLYSDLKNRVIDYSKYEEMIDAIYDFIFTILMNIFKSRENPERVKEIILSKIDTESRIFNDAVQEISGGDRIRRVRVEKGITRKKVFTDLYISRNDYHNIEINRKIPTKEELNKINKYFSLLLTEDDFIKVNKNRKKDG